MEHLLLIGGPTDIVVEPNIGKPAPAARLPHRYGTMRPRLPHLRATPRRARRWSRCLRPGHRARPMSSRRGRPAKRCSARLRSRASASGWEASSRMPALRRYCRCPRPNPNRRSTPRLHPLRRRRPSNRYSRFSPVPEPKRMPAAPPLPPRPAQSEESNLAEMAQRLEAALRRPIKPVEPVPSAPPAPRFSSEPPPLAMPPRTPPPPPPEFAPPPAPPATAREPAPPSLPNEPIPEPAAVPADTVARPAPVFTSIEEEMASLLGRAPGRT